MFTKSVLITVDSVNLNMGNCFKNGLRNRKEAMEALLRDPEQTAGLSPHSNLERNIFLIPSKGVSGGEKKGHFKLTKSGSG